MLILSRIQTYEPQDLTIKSNQKKFSNSKAYGKEVIYGIFMQKSPNILNGTMMF